MRYAWECETDNRIIKLPFGKFFVTMLKKWDLESNHGVDYFISNSKYTAERIKKFYNLDASVIYPPVEIDTRPTGEIEKEDFYFSISRLVTYKRIDLAVKACMKLQKKLVVAGDGPELENLKALAAGHENIKFLGSVSDSEKKQYYQKAKAVIFPADEDFGIVPIEANSFGTVAIALNKGGCRESLLDGTNAVLFDNQTVSSVCGAIEKFEKMRFSPVRIAESAQKFSAENFHKNIKEFIDNIKLKSNLR
jgi:glycosyltransferase involved in cell wall biosynthesis